MKKKGETKRETENAQKEENDEKGVKTLQLEREKQKIICAVTTSICGEPKDRG